MGFLLAILLVILYNIESLKGVCMSFIFNGIRIRKNLTKAQRDALVEDRYQRTDPNTGITSVFRRVTYYDPKLQFNVYVAQQKVGILDPQTNTVVPVRSKKTGSKRRAVDIAVTDALTQASDDLTDNRQTGKVLYGLPPFMEILLCCALGGDFTPKSAAGYWGRHLAFFRKRWGTELPEIAPSISTVNRLLRLIEPSELTTLYQNLVFPLLPQPNQRNVDKDIVAVDGQKIRASRNESGEQHQFLSFYSTEAGIAFAQALIDRKSNEIPAALELAKVLDLRGTIVTGDAMHCQRKFVKTLMNESRADYCLAVKQNQGTLAQEIELCFGKTAVEFHYETEGVAHGRRERRLIEVLPGELLPESLHKTWWGLKYGCIVRQTSWRTEIRAGGKEEPTTEKVRYFISSLNPHEPEIARQLLRAVRSHWQIENHLHYILDVDFGQDRTQMKNANLIENTAQINKLAMAIIELTRRQQNKERKTSRLISFNEIRSGVQNNPQQAIEFIDNFLRQSDAGKMNQEEEPLIH